MHTFQTYTLGADTAAFALVLLSCRESRILALASKIEAFGIVDFDLDH